MHERTITIVGGGVIGTACAHYLAKAGCRVTIVEANAYGHGCSDGNCGLLAFSHVLPLNEPGVVSKTMWSMLSADSPLYIKPRLDPALWGWLMQFAGRCNERCMNESATGLHALIESSQSLYRTLRSEGEVTCEWEQRGCLFVHLHKKSFDEHAEKIALLTEQFNTTARAIQGDELPNFEPSLQEGLAGGFLYEMDGHLRPEAMLKSWRIVLEGMGVEIREKCPVVGFERRDGKVVAVITEQGRIESEAVVLATGALTPKFAKEIGCRVPIQPGKGYSMTMPRCEPQPRMPVMLTEHKVAATPYSDGLRLGSLMEFSGYDRTLSARRMQLLTKPVPLYLRTELSDDVPWTWYGWRPMTYDGRPIIDRAPSADNLFVAAGHNMLGLTLASATGKLIAELVTGQDPHIDPAPYAATRF